MKTERINDYRRKKAMIDPVNMEKPQPPLLIIPLLVVGGSPPNSVHQSGDDAFSAVHIEVVVDGRVNVLFQILIGAASSSKITKSLLTQRPRLRLALTLSTRANWQGL